MVIHKEFTSFTIILATGLYSTFHIPHVLWGQEHELFVWLFPSQFQHHGHADPTVHHVLHKQYADH